MVVSDIVVPVTTDKSNHLVVFPPLRTVQVKPVVRATAAHGNTILDNKVLHRVSALTLKSTHHHFPLTPPLRNHFIVVIIIVSIIIIKETSLLTYWSSPPHLHCCWVPPRPTEWMWKGPRWPTGRCPPLNIMMMIVMMIITIGIYNDNDTDDDIDDWAGSP